MVGPDVRRLPEPNLGWDLALLEEEPVADIGPVHPLDRPDVDIDILADRVERASQLVSLCRERLERARLRVTEIVADLETDD